MEPFHVVRWDWVDMFWSMIEEIWAENTVRINYIRSQVIWRCAFCRNNYRDTLRFKKKNQQRSSFQTKKSENDFSSTWYLSRRKECNINNYERSMSAFMFFSVCAIAAMIDGSFSCFQILYSACLSQSVLCVCFHSVVLSPKHTRTHTDSVSNSSVTQINTKIWK